MKYFKYSDPFLALIAANSLKESNDMYKYQVIGTEPEYVDDCEYEQPQELTEQEARAKYEDSQKNNKEGKSWPGFDNDIKGGPCILLIDGELC